MATINFHSMAESTYLWTAMLAADEKGVDYALTPLALRSPEHLRLHPFGKMPVLQHGDLFLYETLAITHYIDRAFDGPPLQPADARGQAQMLRWISMVNAYIFPTMNRFMKERVVRPAWGFDPDQAFLASARDPLTMQLGLIGDAVRPGGYLVGDRLTLADAFLLPQVLFLGLTPEGPDLLRQAPDVAAWLTRMTDRPSYADGAMRRGYDALLQLPQPAQPIWPSG